MAYGIACFLCGACLIGVGWWHVYFNEDRFRRALFGFVLTLCGLPLVAIGFGLLAL
jgi:hypothetical protein